MNTFYTGAVKSTYDPRDYRYPKIARGMYDWERGFDIEKLTGISLITKDQGRSYSCGGQAWGYYGEVLEILSSKSYESRSAKWIYSHTFVKGGGSAGRVNCDFVKKTGWAQESLVESYEDGKPPSEEFMTSPVTVTNAITEDIEVTKALSYLQVPTSSIDSVAQAINDNYGVILCVGGEDNGTWLSKYPFPPKKLAWNHWLYAGKTKIENGVKYVGVKNSWGNIGENGWQWLSEDYFNSGFISEGWTLAWNYQAPLHKQLLIKIVGLLQQVVALLVKK